MSLNASWVATKPSGKNEVFVVRIDDSGADGQVLGTHFLSYNSTSNLDYFEADSPKGLSTFGLSFLQGTGNLFELITLTVSNQRQNQVHYAGSGNWSQQGNAPDTYSPTAVQTQVVPQATQSPSQTAAVSPSAPPNAGASPPAPTAVSTDVGIIGWLAETFGGHIYLVAAVAIVVVSLLYIRQRRRRFDPWGKIGFGTGVHGARAGPPSGLPTGPAGWGPGPDLVSSFVNDFIGRDDEGGRGHAKIGLAPGFPCTFVEVRVDHGRDQLKNFDRGPSSCCRSARLNVWTAAFVAQ